MTRRMLFGAGAVTALALAGALGLDLPAAGEDATPPTLFELTDVNVFDVRDCTAKLSVTRHLPLVCRLYYGEERCDVRSPDLGTAVVDLGLQPGRGGTFVVDRLDVAARGYGENRGRGQLGPEIVDSLPEGARVRARFVQRRRPRQSSGRSLRPTVISTLTVRARLASGTHVALTAFAPSFALDHDLHAHWNKSGLRGGVVPRAFSRLVYDARRRRALGAVPLERVLLRGALPITAWQTLLLTATWETPTEGTVTFDAPSMYAGRTGTIHVRGDGRYEIRGERGSRIRIVVDPTTGAGTVNLGFGSFRVRDASFLLDGATVIPPGSRGPGDAGAAYLTDQAVLAPDDVVVVSGEYEKRDFHADYAVVREEPPEGRTIWFFDAAGPIGDGPRGRIDAVRIHMDEELTPQSLSFWRGDWVSAPATFAEVVDDLVRYHYDFFRIDLGPDAAVTRSDGRLRGLIRGDGLLVSFDIADPLGGE